MTVQEAIWILKITAECIRKQQGGIDYNCEHAKCDQCVLYYDQGTIDKKRQAMEIVVEVLKEQLSNTSEIPNSSDDLINRQAVIDAQGEKMNRQRKVVITTTYNELGIIVDTKAEELDLYAQPEQRWIPCSERLPDTNRDVLLQFNTNMGVGFWENGEWGVNTGDNIYSEIGEGEAKPIAWMPLPEPYKGET